MGRRSDHTRAELEALFVAEGRRQLAETGLGRFSAREVAKRVGYSIGTLYNVFGSFDGLMLAINARTLSLWAEHLRRRLGEAGEDRICALVHGYFEFAAAHPKAWIALYEHHMADGGPAPGAYRALAADLMGVVAGEVARAVPGTDAEAVLALTRSLVATVHGHCAFALYGAFNMLGDDAPAEAALSRVREALQAAASRSQPPPSPVDRAAAKR